MHVATDQLPIDSTYFQLVRAFPLRPLRDERDLDRAIAVVNRLLDEPELSRDEDDYLAVLGKLIEDYEAEHVRLPDARPVAVIRHLLDANGLNARDLMAILGTDAEADDILNERRPLTLEHIQRLSVFFKLPADVFIGSSES